MGEGSTEIERRVGTAVILLSARIYRMGFCEPAMTACPQIETSDHHA